MTLEAPAFYVEHASAAEKRGDWQGAAALWNVAATASAGYNRKTRYWEAAERCLRKYEEVTHGE